MDAKKTTSSDSSPASVSGLLPDQEALFTDVHESIDRLVAPRAEALVVAARPWLSAAGR